MHGDISIDNPVWDVAGLAVFDYNNVGDEVLVSNLVMEGLLTAYEMELPEGVAEAAQEELFPRFCRAIWQWANSAPLNRRPHGKFVRCSFRACCITEIRRPSGWSGAKSTEQTGCLHICLPI